MNTKLIAGLTASATLIVVLAYLIVQAIKKSKSPLTTFKAFEGRVTPATGTDSNGVVDIKDAITINPYINADGSTNLNTSGVNASDNTYTPFFVPTVPSDNNVTFPAGFNVSMLGTSID